MEVKTKQKETTLLLNQLLKWAKCIKTDIKDTCYEAYLTYHDLFQEVIASNYSEDAILSIGIELHINPDYATLIETFRLRDIDLVHEIEQCLPFYHHAHVLSALQKTITSHKTKLLKQLESFYSFAHIRVVGTKHSDLKSLIREVVPNHTHLNKFSTFQNFPIFKFVYREVVFYITFTEDELGYGSALISMTDPNDT